MSLLCLAHPESQAASKPGIVTGINWDSQNPIKVSDGTYGRIIRMADGALLCGYEQHGRTWVKRSEDEGKTWNEAVMVREISGVSVSNTELLQLRSGRVLLFFNGRPKDKIQKFTIGSCSSDDFGKAWTPRAKPIYEAGTQPGIGCWEPAALQMPSGEVQLFFANEFPFSKNDDQEISLMRSADNGANWGLKQRVCHRTGHRDGMPVPLLLQNGKTVVFSIEDSGLIQGNTLQPAIISSSVWDNWRGSVNGESARRWSALTPPLAQGIYGGAPYLAQLPTGETLLSCQSKEGDRKEPQMVVYIGDENARNFNRRSVPIDLPPDRGGMWNAIFVKDADTVTAITSTVINGQYGMWAIDGHIERK